MAGLLGDVLPYVYSRGNALTRALGGLLSDPVGSAQQTIGLLNDKAREYEGTQAQAFADPRNPLKVTNPGALNRMTQMMMSGPLGFAPVGMTAWHGSPHVFDSFNHGGNLGKGDGFQAQGIGTYLAENPAVAKTYAKQSGNLYRVDLPDSAIPQMLDFGAPVASQRQLGPALNKIHEKYPDLKDAFFSSVRNNEKGQYLFDVVLQKFARDLKGQGVPPGQVYEQANRMTTNVFRDAGLSGFKYPDKGTAQGQGNTSNFVVFDDGLLKVMDRQPVN